MATARGFPCHSATSRLAAFQYWLGRAMGWLGGFPEHTSRFNNRLLPGNSVLCVLCDYVARDCRDRAVHHRTAVEGWALGAGRWASARQDIAALSASRPPSKRPGGRLRYWQCQSMCSPSNVISSLRGCRVPRQHYRSHPTGERSHVTFISLPQRDREPCSELRNVLCRVVLLR